MKKLIAIAVVFALVMGGVFAETSVSGSTNGKLVLGQGSTGEDSKVKAEGSMKIKLLGKNEEGTFGGEFVLNSGNRVDGEFLKQGDAKANVWWKPIDMLKIQIGSNEWGSFGIGDGGTDIYGNMNDLDIWQNVGEGKGFGGYTGKGLFLSVYPIPGLTFNLAFNFQGKTDPKEVYEKFYAELVYAIPNIGTVKAGYKSNTYEYKAPGEIGVSFDLSALSGMGLALGFQLHTGFPTADADLAKTRTEPLNTNFSAGFTGGDFNVKFRFVGTFLGKETVNDVESKDSATIKFGLFPNYKVSDNLFVGVGFDVKVAGITDVEGAADPVISWHASPHIRYTVGPGLFQAGLNVGQNTGKVITPVNAADKGKLEWQIPIRMAYSF